MSHTITIWEQTKTLFFKTSICLRFNFRALTINYYTNNYLGNWLNLLAFLQFSAVCYHPFYWRWASIRQITSISWRIFNGMVDQTWHWFYLSFPHFFILSYFHLFSELFMICLITKVALDLSSIFVSTTDFHFARNLCFTWK